MKFILDLDTPSLSREVSGVGIIVDLIDTITHPLR